MGTLSRDRGGMHCNERTTSARSMLLVQVFTGASFITRSMVRGGNIEGNAFIP